MKLLSIRNLSVNFKTDKGTVYAVDDVSFTVKKGETVSIIGESGSGKTATVESIARLLDPKNVEIKGEIFFEGTNILDLSKAKLKDIRGNKIGYIFQDPDEALNPVFSIGWQIAEAIKIHRDISEEKAKRKTIDILDKVGIPDPTNRFNDYPHELSGGMKQRVMVAIALAPNPDLLIADEPTTGLDVTIQTQILSLIKDIQQEFNMSVLLVTHDLSVATSLADRLIVFYAGKIMEKGDINKIFEDPLHPYTKALFNCIPGRQKNGGIPGQPPSPLDPPKGCRFHPRCNYTIDECKKGNQPRLVPHKSSEVSCIHYYEGYNTSILDK